MSTASPWRRSLLVAAAYLLLAFAIQALARQAFISPQTAMRLGGMMLGLMLVAQANTIPKRLAPLARMSCDPAREQALRRSGAWALVLGGLGYTLAYALAPVDIAAPLAICLLAPPTAGVAIVRARCAWKRRGAA